MFFRKLTKTDPGTLNALSLAGTIGLHMVSGIGMGAVAGHLLDVWLDSHPWGLIIFMVVGIVAGFKNVYVDARRLIAAQNTLPGGAPKQGDAVNADATVTPGASLIKDEPPASVSSKSDAAPQGGSAQPESGSPQKDAALKVDIDDDGNTAP